MKIASLVIASLLALAIDAGAKTPLPEGSSFRGTGNELPAGSGLTVTGGTLTLKSGSLTSGTGATVNIGQAIGTVIPFNATATVVSGTAGSATVTLLPSASVPVNKKVYVNGYRVSVSGTTAWTTITNLSIQNTGTSGKTFATIPVASLTSTANLYSAAAGGGQQAAFLQNQAGPAGAGLVISTGTLAGAGSTIYVTAYGLIQ